MNIKILLFILLLTTASNASALKHPDKYDDNMCELIAKDIIREHPSARMIWLQPLQSNGAYQLGEYSAHIIVSIQFSGKQYFIFYKAMDFFITDGHKYYIPNNEGQRIFNSVEDTIKHMEELTGKKYELFDLSTTHPPFQIIWNYN